MSDTQMQIETLLVEVKAVLDQITPLRQAVARLQDELTEVEQAYESRLGSLDRERLELEQQRRELDMLLLGEQPPVVEAEETLLPAKTPPPVVTASFDRAEPAAPRPRQDPRHTRKRALKNHLVSLPGERPEELKLALNKALEDPEQDVGHMLERLAWGELWEASSFWEQPSDQLARLQTWHEILQERLDFWQARRRYLEESDPRSGLWREKQQRSEGEWRAYLEELAALQEGELEKLRQQVARRQRRYEERQTATGGR